MEKNTILAIVLSTIILVAWSFFMTPSTPPPPAQTQTAPTADKTAAQGAPEKTAAQPAPVTSSTVPTGVLPPAGPETVPFGPARDIKVKTGLYTAIFTEAGGRLKSLTLNKYRTTPEADSPPKEMVIVENQTHLPLALSFKSGRLANLSNNVFKADKTEIDISQSGNQATLSMVYVDSSGLEITRTYKFENQSYLIGMGVGLRNYSSIQIDDNLVVNMASEALVPGDRYNSFGAWIDDDLLELRPNEVAEKLDAYKNKNYKLTWAAYEDQHFLTGLLPGEPEKTRFSADKYAKGGIRLSFICSPLVMAPQTEKSYHFQVYYGPKDYNILKSMGNGLDRSIYFGWVDILSKPLLIAMTWLYGYVPNYGIVIIILTIIIKILFWPLTAKSYKSMKAMQKLQPKIVKLREKYKEDRESMNREMMQLYKTYKVNPMGGCLPMLIQIPVFIALYRLLDYSLELRHAPFWLWINDLSAPDRLFHFNFKIPFMDEPTGIPILTLLMGASMIIQQKMTPTPGDPMQAKIMMWMPVFFTVIFINFPSGLVVYWLVNNILSIGQQTLINKRTN